MDLLALVARLTLDKSDYDQGLDDASKGAQSFGDKLKGGLGTAAKAGAAAVNAVAGAAKAAAGALVSNAGATAAYGDNIDKASQKMGISAEAYQEWDAVMQHSGSSIDSLQRGMMTLSTVMDELSGSAEPIVDPEKVKQTQDALTNAQLSVEKAQIAYDEAVAKNGKSSSQAQKALINLQQAQNKAEQAEWKHARALEGETKDLSVAAVAIKALGVETKDASGEMRAQEDVFADAITALQGIEDESQRTALAQKIFGRGAMELGPLLNTSAEDTKAMRDRVHELGGVMSDEAVKAAAGYQDSLQDMTTAFDGLKRNLMSEFLPSITTVMDGLTEMVTGGGTEKLTEGINAFVDTIGEVVPRILEKGSEIILALSQAIIENLPSLIDAAVQTLFTFANGIIEQLPTLVEAGLQIILSLADALVQNLPSMIPSIVDVVLKIVDTLTQPDTLSNLINAALEIIVALAEGLIKALPQLIAKIPEIILNIVQAIIQSLPKINESGVKLIGALAKGIVNSVGSVISAIGQVGQGIINSIGNIISGAWNWGKDLMENFASGLKKFISAPIDAVKGFAGKIKNFLGFSEPEEGPLSNFHTYAPDMMKLFAQGITDNRSLITKAIGGAFDVGPQIAANTGTGQTFTTPAAGMSAQRNIVVKLILDGRELAQTAFPYLSAEEQRVGMSLVTR